jgi:hypothetical protein
MRLLAQVRDVPRAAIIGMVANTYGGYLANLRDPRFRDRMIGRLDCLLARIRVHAPARIERLAVAAQRPEERRVLLVAMPDLVEIGADALRGLRVDRQRLAPPALADHAQRIEAAILMQVSTTLRVRREINESW